MEMAVTYFEVLPWHITAATEVNSEIIFLIDVRLHGISW
jgi:hypothetical protein